MKKLTILCIMCFLMVTVVTTLNADVSKEMKKLQIYTEEFVPLNFMQDGEITGQSTEVVKILLERLELEKDITLLPWSDAYQKLLDETDVALYSTCLTAERKDLFKWVGPISSVEIYFYASKDHMADINTLEDAKKLKKMMMSLA